MAARLSQPMAQKPTTFKDATKLLSMVKPDQVLSPKNFKPPVPERTYMATAKGSEVIQRVDSSENDIAKAPSPPRARQDKTAESGEHHETERPDLKAAGITRLLSQRGGKNLDSKQLPILPEQLQEMRAS